MMIDEKSAAESIEIVEDAITLKALAEYLAADMGKCIGVYADGSYAVGPDIGNEIDPAERPMWWVRLRSTSGSLSPVLRLMQRRHR